MKASLAAYNTVQSAADIADLGPALGYRHVNLFGNSYGTTLALQVMRDHPTGIRSVVMDGIAGLPFNGYNAYNATTWQGLQQVFADCVELPTCNTNYPHLQQTFTRLLALLQAHPAKVEGFSPPLGRGVSATMGGIELWNTMKNIVSDPTGPPLAPQIIESFAAGDYHIAVQFVGVTLSEGSTAADSLGMHYSMICSGEQSGTSPAAIAAHSQMVPASVRSEAIAYLVGDLKNCDVWRVPSIPSINHTYFHSSIPTLFLPGRYDATTPPSMAKVLAPRLGHAYVVPIPTLSHLVVGYRWCPDSIASEFLAHPNRKPTASCVGQQTMAWQ